MIKLILPSNIFSLLSRMGATLKSIKYLSVRLYKRVFRRYLKPTEIEIDQSTILKDVSIAEIEVCKRPSQTIVVAAVDVEAKQHKLSVLSDNITEKEIYVNRTFQAQEMTLECLFDQYWFPEYGFLVSKKGKVWRHSVLGQYGDPHFLTTHAVEDREMDDGTKAYIFHEHLLKEAPVIDEPSLITSHYASHNYGHFMLDMVPLIQLGMKLGLNMITRPLLEWHKPIYHRIGVVPDRVTIVTERVVFLKKVFVSNRHNSVSTYAASPHHREVFADILKNIPKSTENRTRRRIFLSRGDVRSRNLCNRTALEAVLRKEGFETVRPEQLSFDEQALLFSNADIIVSEFGAVMANVVFCKRGTKVIEIIPDMQNDPWSRHLCASMDLEHITLCHAVKEEDREAFEIAGKILKNLYFSFDANIELIRGVVKQLS